MKLAYKYKNYTLGILEYDTTNECFIYNSNTIDEERAKQQTLGLLDYHLYNSNNLKSKEIFLDFKNWVEKPRNDAKSICNISDKDSYWDILVKLASNNFTMGDYYFSIT